jgi:cystathionine gamma-synthase
LDFDPRKLKTLAVRAGEEGEFWEYSLLPPVAQTSTYRYPSIEHLKRFLKGELFHPEYSRYYNPTVRVAEEKISALESAEDSLLLSSGMAALSLIFLTLLKPPAHVILTGDHYIGVRLLLKHLKAFGIEYTLVPENPRAIIESKTPHTQLFFSEYPTNPHLHLFPLEPVLEWARKERIVTVMDSTLATPVLFRPLEWGADLVVHSATKYLGGHNDLLAGAIAGRKEMISALREVHGAIFGAVCAPWEAYLLNRGIKTLPHRVEAVSLTAEMLCERLASHPRVAEVFYPRGELRERYLSGKGGGLLSFRVRGGEEEAGRVVDRLKIAQHAVSLGGAETLVSIPSFFIQAFVQSGEPFLPSPDLIRVSVGLEDPEDLCADFLEALG